MEVQKNNTEWIGKMFSYAMSKENKGMVTEAVLQRLVNAKAERIFYLGYADKQLRGLANVLVKTAYQEIDDYAKTGKEKNSLSERRKFFADPWIIDACNSVGVTYAKTVVYALNEMFDRFGGNIEGVKEVLRYVGLRENDDAGYDVHSMEQIARHSNTLSRMELRADREKLMVKVLISTRRQEEEIAGLEQLRVDEQLEMQKIDPDWFNNNAVY